MYDVTKELVMQSSAEQRERFFNTILWKDICTLVDHYYEREKETICNPERFGEAGVHIERLRGRLDILRAITVSLSVDMLPRTLEMQEVDFDDDIE